MRTDVAFLIPVYNAGPLLARVMTELRAAWREGGEGPEPFLILVDDGSTDGGLDALAEIPSVLLRHPGNRGKGAALRTGLAWAKEHGIRTLVSLDADAQHPGREAVRLALHKSSPKTLLLAVRDLKGAKAPKPSQLSNRFSNLVLSLFSGVQLRDTQCGLRRYPVDETLALDSREDGYAFEADIVLRAARTGLPIEHLDCAVYYPPAGERVSHFHSVRDPARIVRTVVRTTLMIPRKP